MQNRVQRMPLSQMWYYPLQTYGGRRHVFSSHRQHAHFLTGTTVPVSHPITHHEWSPDLVADAHSCEECDHYQLQQPTNLPYFPPSSMCHRLYWCCCPHQYRWKLKTPQSAQFVTLHLLPPHNPMVCADQVTGTNVEECWAALPPTQ